MLLKSMGAVCLVGICRQCQVPEEGVIPIGMASRGESVGYILQRRFETRMQRV